MTPERKTVEALLREVGNGVISKSTAIEAMQAYARQEVEKHLQLAVRKVPLGAIDCAYDIANLEITLT